MTRQRLLSRADATRRRARRAEGAAGALWSHLADGDRRATSTPWTRARVDRAVRRAWSTSNHANARNDTSARYVPVHRVMAMTRHHRVRPHYGAQSRPMPHAPLHERHPERQRRRHHSCPRMPALRSSRSRTPQAAPPAGGASRGRTRSDAVCGACETNDVGARRRASIASSSRLARLRWMTPHGRIRISERLFRCSHNLGSA